MIPGRLTPASKVGGPAQISVLAQAFHDAGRCTAESSAAFDVAGSTTIPTTLMTGRNRFEVSMNEMDLKSARMRAVEAINTWRKQSGWAS